MVQVILGLVMSDIEGEHIEGQFISIGEPQRILLINKPEPEHANTLFS